MTIVTGKIENAAGTTLHAKIDFKSTSTPLVAAGIVTTNTDKTVRSNPSDGTFSVPLAAGNYTVTIAAENQTTTFNIVVPPGNSTVSIESIVATPLAFVYTPPNTVWNGVRIGHITFVPIANPAAVTMQAITFTGGQQGATDLFAYQIAWQTPSGDITQASPDATNNPPASPHNATRVFLPTPPSGISAVLIFRSTDDATLNRYFLTSVDPSAAYYDDWESTADFNARINTSLKSPAFNNTAGKLLSSVGTICAMVTDQGLLFPGANCRVKSDMGLQIYNFDTQLWHTLLVVGNPPQLGIDAGNPN